MSNIFLFYREDDAKVDSPIISEKKIRFARKLYNLRRRKSTAFDIPRTNFKKIVKKICREILSEPHKDKTFTHLNANNIRFTREALDIIQLFIEHNLLLVFEDLNNAAIHGKRITIKDIDIYFLNMLNQNTLMTFDKR